MKYPSGKRLSSLKLCFLSPWQLLLYLDQFLVDYLQSFYDEYVLYWVILANPLPVCILAVNGPVNIT